MAYSGQLRRGGEVFLNVLINIGTIARGRKDAHAICVRGTAVAHMWHGCEPMTKIDSSLPG